MQDVEVNLQRISQTVLEQARNKLKQLENELEKKKKETLEKREDEFLSEAYKKIQKSIAKSTSDTNETIAKTQAECKAQLITRRDEIIKEVFDNVNIRISEFISSDQYYRWLLGIIKETITMAGDGDISLMINRSDEKWLTDLQKDVAVSEISILDEDIIGGAKAMNKTKGRVIDNSIKLFLEQQKGSFLRFSGLSIV